MPGQVLQLFVTERAVAPMQPLDEVRATPAGLVGDRYAVGEGTFSTLPGSGRALTLVAREDLLAVEGETGIRLEPHETRRNVLTAGIALNDLIGLRFRIGEVECIGRRPAAPCAHLDTVTGLELLKPMANRGGLRADVLVAGTIRVGDPIEVLGPSDCPSG